jgi:hypothetical protein
MSLEYVTEEIFAGRDEAIGFAIDPVNPHL